MSLFSEFLESRLETSGFSTEDCLASFLPLVRQVIETHSADQVAPLDVLDALHVEGVRIWFPEARCTPASTNWPAVRKLQRPQTSAVEVIEETRRTSEDDGREFVNLQVGQRGQEVDRPIYLPGYVSWEHEIGHHDPLTDVFSLGLILASLACGLDMREPDSLARFVAHRHNLFALNSDLHPVLAQAIVRMTELDRHHRPQDLPALLASLENYLDQQVDLDVDLARIQDFTRKDLSGKHEIVLSKLQERLFEISRRNRLLHFRPTLQTLNLTHASVPLSFDVRNIRPDQILTWDEQFSRALVGGQAVSLNKYLNFREALYVPSVLDRIGAEARRDQNEFGFAQLRLVACFLRWTNLKEKPVERFDSPLVLLPVKLTKKKGIRDTYWLELVDTVAEINPVVRHQFKQLYDIDLPETVDLSSTDLDALFDFLTQRISASESAVTLDKIDRPRIDLIHDRARRRLDQYRRAARIGGRGVRSFLDLDYSYDAANYHPLGIKLFSAKIRPPTTRLQEIVEECPRPRSFVAPDDSAPVAEKERQFYALRQPTVENPYTWEFDLCSVTLGNFKYRKMSLVRDYTEALQHELTNEAFDSIFSLAGRPVEGGPPASSPLEDRHHVVPCDPTQATAIAQAQSGKSYIIQGPPGTGKSQTITNLIADFVVRGKRVLFVCEKRAAIDVVFLRLRQQGLDQLCCLIHDSQADKKQFVMDLKNTYETFLAEADRPASSRQARQTAIEAIRRELEPLDRFGRAMVSVPESAGVRLRSLLGRAIELYDARPTLSPCDREHIPRYAAWEEHRDQIGQMLEALGEIQPDGILAGHPLRKLNSSIASAEQPLEQITTQMDAMRRCLSQFTEAHSSTGIPEEQSSTIETARHLMDYARHAEFLASRGLMGLVEPGSEIAAQFATAAASIDAARDVLTLAQQKTKAWNQKPPREELEIALAQARSLEGSWFAFLKPVWWQLRGVLRRSYDFSSHVVRPTWTQMLTWLCAEYDAADALRAAEMGADRQFEIGGDVSEFFVQLAGLRRRLQSLPASVQPFHEALIAGRIEPDAAVGIVRAGATFESLCQYADQLLSDCEDRTFGELEDDLDAIEESLDELPDFLYCLRQLADFPPPLARALRTMPLAAPSLESACAARSLEQSYREDRELGRFRETARRRHVARLEKLVDRWHEINARVVRGQVRDGFLKNVGLSAKPAAQLTPEEKEFKKRYRRGRRELEHEFGKTMRYKSIRDMVEGDSGMVVRDLKPVWLMSPLSVADTLPLVADQFDVVIFDEASQITLEEAVPCVLRAGQAIVVGDQMQLPPTNFFSAKRSEEEDPLYIEEAGELVEYDLDTGSFLSHAARNMPSTMLGWHYRSRSESLISFSNWAFYEGRLLTVPEEQVGAVARPELRAARPEDAADHVAPLLERAVSFHFMEHGIYEKRRNRAEADYIAHLVRGILLGGSGKSIGVVAFSEAQQGEIEAALNRLAQEDRTFGDALEVELERERDGEFVGLLVKNLENIQGDERDVVMMSVCYGRPREGKMLMNFGPINMSGGEKRLNVAFSRAKHHMALVSSITYAEIKNDYNDGANSLKNYLRYAEASSMGNQAAAERVLRSLNVWRGEEDGPVARDVDAVVSSIAARLVEAGLLVDTDIGQSHFRCNLGVRREGEPTYRLGILVDTPEYYQQADLLEREMMKPRLLRAFGWRVAWVLAKDWYDDPDSVLDRLLALIDREDDQDGADDEEPIELALEDQPSSDEPASASTQDDGAPNSMSDGQSEPRLSPEAVLTPSGEQVAPTQAGGSAGSPVRRFEHTGGNSSKFWEISVAGGSTIVRFGRLGTSGQTREKKFASAADAQRDAQRLIRSKLAKGYRELPNA